LRRISLSITNNRLPFVFGPAFANAQLKFLRIKRPKNSPLIYSYGTLSITPLPYAIAKRTCKRVPPAKFLQAFEVNLRPSPFRRHTRALLQEAPLCRLYLWMKETPSRKNACSFVLESGFCFTLLFISQANRNHTFRSFSLSSPFFSEFQHSWSPTHFD